MVDVQIETVDKFIDMVEIMDMSFSYKPVLQKLQVKKSEETNLVLAGVGKSLRSVVVNNMKSDDKVITGNHKGDI